MNVYVPLFTPPKHRLGPSSRSESSHPRADDPDASQLAPPKPSAPLPRRYPAA